MRTFSEAIAGFKTRGLRTLISLSVTGAVLLSPLQSFAWGPIGHRANMVVATKELQRTPEGRETLKILLEILNAKKNGKASGSTITLDQVANLADQLRADPRYAGLAQLHFANVPEGIDSYQQLKKDGLLNPEGDVVSSSLYLPEYFLTGDKSKLSLVPALAEQDKITPVDPKFVEEVWLHFLGDNDQPLHLGHVDDKGGNMTIVDLEYGGQTAVNFHSMIDGLLKQPFSFTEYAQDAYNSITNKMRKKWNKQSFLTSTNESIQEVGVLYGFFKNFRTTQMTLRGAPSPYNVVPDADGNFQLKNGGTTKVPGPDIVIPGPVGKNPSGDDLYNVRIPILSELDQENIAKICQRQIMRGGVASANLMIRSVSKYKEAYYKYRAQLKEERKAKKEETKAQKAQDAADMVCKSAFN